MLKLKLQCFGHLMQRTDSFEKTLMLERLKVGGGGDDRGWDAWMACPTQWTWVWVNSGSWWWTGRPGVLQFTGSQRDRQDWVTFISLHVYWVSDAVSTSHPLLPSSPFAFNLSQHQGLFQGVDSSHQVAKVLELQLQHQSFKGIFRIDFL